MKHFKNKVVVITGAGSGIGKALAEDFANRGAWLAISDINAQNLEAVREQLASKTKVFSQAFDVSEEAAMQDFAQKVYNHYQKVEVVINNAGVAQTGAEFLEISTEDFHWLMNINFWGVLHGSKSFLPYLRQQKESSLVNVSSIFGMIGVPSQTSYNASKFAVRGFTEALSLEERNNQTGVTVAAVHPGGIQTNILRNARGVDWSKVEEQEKIFKTPPHKAAQTIIKGIQKKKDRILIGKDAYLIHYANKFLRKLVQKATIYNYRQTK